MGRQRWDAIVGTVAAIVVMGAAGMWQWRVAQRAPRSIEPESGQHVRERFPMPSATLTTPEAPADLSQTIVRANPFSPDRRPLAPDASGPSLLTSTPVALEPPQFIYKGRIMMSGTPRAIVEERTKKKTYFVQVGQQLAGYTVEAIQDQQLVLTDATTRESRIIPLAASSAPSVSSPTKSTSWSPPVTPPQGKTQTSPATP